MADDLKPKIILLGHTSAGKTTLLRTLVRREVGEIAERANVTQTQEPVEHESLQALFIDSPGFQQAGKLNLAIKYKIDVDAESDLIYDARAYNGIKLADVIIYVASLEVTPDDGHRQELLLVGNTNLPVVAVLNKCGGLYQMGDIRVIQRHDEWAKCLREFGIPFVQFDAHFDEYGKLGKLYTLLQSKLSPLKAAELERGIREFDRRINFATEAEFLAFQELLLELQALRAEANDSDHEYDESKTAAHLKSVIEKEINIRLSEVALRCANIWQLTTTKYDLPYERFAAEIEKETRVADLTKAGAAQAAGFATLGSGVGAILGAIVGTFILPLVGTASGAATGASWGGAVGGGFGVLVGTAGAIKGHHKMKLKAADLQFVAQKAVIMIWTISNHGYGKSSAVNLQLETKRLSQYDELIKSKGERLGEPLDRSALSRFYYGNMKLLDASI